MKLFSFLEKRSEEEEPIYHLRDFVAGIGVDDRVITREEALNIPALSSCIELISNTIAILPVKLYKKTEDAKEEIDDYRIKLINENTNDTLDGYQFKKAIVRDYLLDGKGYSYINRERNKIKSLNYVPNNYISVVKNSDIVFKDYKIYVQGKTYNDYEFLKITRNSEDGITGTGVLQEFNETLKIVYSYIMYELILLKTNGNKKGFLKSSQRLSKEAIEQLKNSWKELYSKDNQMMILNNGLDFQEISSTSVEMDLNNNKKTNDDRIYNMFNVPRGLLDGNVNLNDTLYNNFIKLSILPILKAIETSLNKDLLLESEKGSFYFAFDTKELLKGDIERRFKAYEIAVKNGIMQIDEIRYIENMKPLGFDFVKLGLQDVLYDPETGEIYTPNSGTSYKLGENLINAKGGENVNEDGIEK